MLAKLFKRRVVTLAVGGAVLFCAAFLALITGDRETAETAAVTDWGLSFQTEGEAPLANATEEYLEKFNAMYVGDQTEKTLYITFDAGFENGNTAQILDALKKHNVKATFFLVGNYFETQPELVKRMVEEGHTVGNHTYSHPDMSAISDAASFTEQLQKNEALYREITGQEMPKLYRPPQGKFCESNLQMANELGYSTVFWSLAYVDWYTEDQPTKEQAFSKLLPRVHPGAVVLLHSTSSTNAQILDELLTEWEGMGYSFGDLESLCASKKNAGAE
ncbi:MAG: polysaccharide deacetylase family protein [Clostridia bacterium]|nr:polysaccharide deacetylase family protein [Clostridia bacterium]